MPGRLSWLSVCLWLRSWSQGPGISPASGSPLSGEPTLPSLSTPHPLPLKHEHALFLSPTQINKILKKKKKTNKGATNKATSHNKKLFMVHLLFNRYLIIYYPFHTSIISLKLLFRYIITPIYKDGDIKTPTIVLHNVILNKLTKVAN